MKNKMQKAVIEIDNRVIRKESRDIYLIAEIGVNYYDIAGKMGISPVEAAKFMIKQCADAKVEAVKFQVYKAEKLASKYSPLYWNVSKESAKSQFEIFKKYDKLTYKDYLILAKECSSLGVDFLITPFDLESVDTFHDLVPAYKIASADITNKPLLKKIAQKKKPVIISTGASNIPEIEQAVEWILESHNEQIAILHCILSYPTEFKDANLGMIKCLNKLFPNFVVGYSDHVLADKNMDVLTAAFLLGANIIEKHFTTDKSIKENDHRHSMDISDITKFKSRINFANNLRGLSYKKPVAVEFRARKFARRSIIAKVNIKAGEIISEDKITVKRPGIGISPKFWENIIEKRALVDIKEDEILEWKMLE